MFRGDGITWMKRSRLFVLFFLGGSKPWDGAGSTQWADFGLYAKEAPRAPETDRIQRTQLPLALGDTMRVALVGNTLFERMGHYGFLNRGSIRNIRKPNSSSETWLGQRIRSVCDLDPDNFADLEQHLFRVQADLILMAFGFNESFSGKQGLEAFERALHDWVSQLQRLAFNGHSAHGWFWSPPLPVRMSGGCCRSAKPRTLGSLLRSHAACSPKAGGGLCRHVDPFTRLAGPVVVAGNHQWRASQPAGLSAFLRRSLSRPFWEKPPETNPELRHAVIEKNKQFFSTVSATEYLLLHRGS